MSIDKIKNGLYGTRFVPIDNEEMTALELIGTLIAKANEIIEHLDTKTDLYGDHKGTWHGLTLHQSSEGLASDWNSAKGTFETVTDRLKNIDDEISTLISNVKGVKDKNLIGCVLRPVSNLTAPWVLFEDGAHEKSGINKISYNDDGTLSLLFDKTYNKIQDFNVYTDEMLKIYGLEVGASVGLSSAKLYLISNLTVNTAISFSLTNGITCSSGFIESVEWVSGLGAKIKFKNVPKQSPNGIQVTLSNSLHLSATASITGNREITIKFYKEDNTLITDITGNWSCMISTDFTGKVDFNSTSVYDENILSSSAILFSATLK